MIWGPGDAKRYRERAEELRAKADLFGAENRAMLLNMADYYEGFAREAEMEYAAQRRSGDDGRSK